MNLNQKIKTRLYVLITALVLVMGGIVVGIVSVLNQKNLSA